MTEGTVKWSNDLITGSRKKRNRKKGGVSWNNKAVETDETEKDPFNGEPESIGPDQHQLPELYNGNN